MCLVSTLGIMLISVMATNIPLMSVITSNVLRMYTVLKVLTSMGAGGKADPTRLRIAPLSDCVNDPLASKIKWKLKKHCIDAESVMSLFSIEKPTDNLLPLDEEQFLAGPQSYGAVDDMRVRVMPVLGR